MCSKCLYLRAILMVLHINSPYLQRQETHTGPLQGSLGIGFHWMTHTLRTYHVTARLDPGDQEDVTPCSWEEVSIGEENYQTIGEEGLLDFLKVLFQMPCLLALMNTCTAVTFIFLQGTWPMRLLS